MGPVVYFGLCLLGFLACSSSVEGVRDLSSPRPRSPCPPGALYYLNVCYEYLENALNWQDAEDACQYYKGGQLASIRSKAEGNIISKYIKSIKQESSVWIGFHATSDSSKLKWEWSDGLPYSSGSALWDGRRPPSPSSDQCIALSNAQQPAAPVKWAQFHCSYRFAYLCKYPAA